MEVDLLEGAKGGGGGGCVSLLFEHFCQFFTPPSPHGENLEVKPYKNTGNNYSSITLR